VIDLNPCQLRHMPKISREYYRLGGFNFYERLTNQGQFLLVARAGIDYVLLAALENVSMAALCGSAKKRVEAHPV
jgi:hypothetical protein